ncbi:MAG TPA: Rne/Rng family ribonuclease [Verrucomicrobiae bacterium]|nr:Rne/Rng family ribonuclease [Verrucomicrobiae bacterium]
MAKELVISATPHETRVAILEEGQLCEFYVEREKEFALVGSVYKGRVTRVLPGMQSAFVDIGLDSDAFLYVSDFLEEIEELDHIVTTVEEKVQKMEDQGGDVLPSPGAAAPVIEPADVENTRHSPAADASLITGRLESLGRFEPAEHPAPAGGHVLTPLPGETFTPGNSADPSSSEGGSSSAPYSRHSGPPSRDRGRFDRGGRGRFDRRGGRGGRHGGRRGGREGNRPFNRELPSSKYASPRPYESSPSEPAAEGYVPVILPGESFAKYRERPPQAAGETAAPEVTESPANSWEAGSHPEPANEAAAETGYSERSAPPPTAFTREEIAPSSSASVSLPGESIAKYRSHAGEAEERFVPAPESPEISDSIHAADEASFADLHEELPHHDELLDHAPESGAHFELHEVEEEPFDAPSISEEARAAGLTPEEAQHVAEHIAEAQADEASRDARIAEHAQEHESADGSHSEEDAELEAEEADAETEGMLAPPEENGNVAEIPAEASAPGDNSEAMAASAPSAAEDSQPWRASVRHDFRARMQHPARRGGRDRGRDRDRGRRPQHGPHGGHHRPQQRRPQLIGDMLKQGQEIIVQIAKEPLGKKGARITSHIALPGRYLVYMPTLDHTGVSRKIASAETRSRLRHLVNEAKGSAGGGFIVRTAAASAPPEDIRADVEFLTKAWADTKARSEQRKAPSLLHRDLNLVERILRDHLTPDFTAIWVDSEEEYTKVVDFVSRFQSQLVSRVKLYTKETPVFEEFGIQQEIDKGLRPKVWLKSGGYIVINHTEALVAIDVNTGKFVGKGSTRLEDTIVRTNLEAVKEIVRQMRLRDLGGIIIIDFIDMEERRNREKVMAALEDALRADRAPSKVLRFNEFGLVAITRKRTKQALERTLCQPCPYCTGSGMVKSIPTLCYEIQAEAKKMAPEMDSASITLRVHPEISKALKTRESVLIEELERWTKKSVIIQSDPTLHWEQYDIY